MTIEELVKSLHERFNNIFSQHIDKTLLERYQLVKEMPNAGSSFEAAVIFYSSQNKLKHFRWMIGNKLLKTLTDEEILLVYTEPLHMSLDTAILNFRNITENENEKLIREIPFVTSYLLPCFIESFKDKVNNSQQSLDNIHEDMIFSAIEKLAKSNLFDTCDADLYSAFSAELYKALEKINNFLVNNIFAQEINNPEYSCFRYNLEHIKIVNIYKMIRKENNLAKDILPELKIVATETDSIEQQSNQLELISILNTSPWGVIEELNDEVEDYINNNSIFTDFINEFTAKYYNILIRHADTVANSHHTMNTRDRTELCKNNTLKKIAFATILADNAANFAKTLTSSFIKEYKNGFWLGEPDINIIIDCFLLPLLHDKFSNTVYKKLHPLFKWPKQRATPLLAPIGRTRSHNLKV